MVSPSTRSPNPAGTLAPAETPGPDPARSQVVFSADLVVCVGDAWCICPLPDHVTDAERAVMDDVCGQATRLATALRWVLALAALVVLLVLVR